MALPTDPTKADLDQATDDPKQGRVELATLVDWAIALSDHLEISDITKEALTPGDGLQRILTELEIQLQANPGLAVAAGGLIFDIPSLTDETAPAAADSVAFYDASAGAHREGTIPNLMKGALFANIGNVTEAADGQFVKRSGANYVGADPVAAASISQSKLKTTTETKTITPTPTTVNTTLASTYTLGADFKQSLVAASQWNVLQTSAVNYAGNPLAYDIGTSFVNHLIMSYNRTAETFSARYRYVQASPPYDLGDGEVPLFIFLAMKADGTIGHASIAEDPPWAGNGPTDITPDLIDLRTGKKFKKRPTGPLFTLAEIRADAGKRAAHIASLKAARHDEEFTLVEISNAMKNADMALIPHPMLGHSDDEPPMTRVLIDPTSKEAEELLFLSRDGEDVGKIIQDFWTIDNVDLPRGKPPGIMAVRGRWKPPGP